jgi:hypothetical protein
VFEDEILWNVVDGRRRLAYNNLTQKQKYYALL